jgi:hypothetical protein
LLSFPLSPFSLLLSFALWFAKGGVALLSKGEEKARAHAVPKGKERVALLSLSCSPLLLLQTKGEERRKHERVFKKQSTSAKPDAD